MSIQGSVNQLLGIAGIFGGLYKKIYDEQEKKQQKSQNIIEKKQDSKKTPNSYSQTNNTSLKRIVINSYIKAEQALQKEGSYRIVQNQMQAQRRKERGELE